ncbi:type II toxin-antitoxin system prevent-host-death family antitoxin [Ottowia thiooxydans]|uniref:type II toxin-antitoxin system prevent-host-death family antitoxin n=1 Tax=Ottowia thiooxydans TaxID=219182 RepID=UPI0004119789|nr:type II toxin-antitoxin system prevent-host-death family antitoxin [Ottowia thiooxydans]
MSAIALAFDQLPRTPASDVKKLGWRGVMRAVGREGKVLVTNHDRPEAVILSPDEYERLTRAAAATEARQEDAIDALRRRFDDRLATLQQADAGQRLREVFAQGPELQGKVLAGGSH